MGWLDYLGKNNFVIGDPADRFDRTNINSGIFQVRQTITEVLTKKNPLLENNSFDAVVLWVSDPTPVLSPASPLPGTDIYVQLPTVRVKIYFRVPTLHSNIPLPNSFREEYKSELSKLKPDDENELLISCHPNLYADYSEYSNIIPGDVIEILFEDKTYSSAKILKLKKKAINNITVATPASVAVEDIFDESPAVSTVASSDPSIPCEEPIPSLGSNQAKYYQEACRGPNEITTIMLHSTDGSSGNGRAQKTIKRFAEGPTLYYEWTNSATGEKIGNPSCDLVMSVDGKLPEGTICHPKRKQVEKPVKTSIHYAVDQGGNVIQGVLDKDIATHSGSRMNKVSIGIEMNGKPAIGPGEGYLGLYSKMYNDKLVNSVAMLVADLCTKYNIPVDREHIKGHYELYSNQENSRRFDPGNDIGWKKRGYPPGNYWNWNDFLERVKTFQGNAETS